jgi:hypothetical protein
VQNFVTTSYVDFGTIELFIGVQQLNFFCNYLLANNLVTFGGFLEISPWWHMVLAWHEFCVVKFLEELFTCKISTCLEKTIGIFYKT